MDKATLVNVDIESGAEVLKSLDQANLKVSVALWLFSPDHEDWFLVLASPEFDKVGPREGYGLVHSALNAAGVPLERTPALMILRMNDSLIRGLRRIFGKTKSVNGMRLGGQMIGDRFIEDAYVYRIS
jgi:hypothetical protein